MQPQQVIPETIGRWRAGGSPDALIQFLLSQMESAVADEKTDEEKLAELLATVAAVQRASKAFPWVHPEGYA